MSKREDVTEKYADYFGAVRASRDRSPRGSYDWHYWNEELKTKASLSSRELDKRAASKATFF